MQCVDGTTSLAAIGKYVNVLESSERLDTILQVLGEKGSGSALLSHKRLLRKARRAVGLLAKEWRELKQKDQICCRWYVVL